MGILRDGDIQRLGFLVMTLALAAIAIIPGAGNTGAFLVMFAISYFFIESGPNMTTFVYPAEISASTALPAAAFM